MVLKKIQISRFKSLNDITLDLAKINILVGSNNSGKSSILQAIQFAVSVAQTTGLEKSAYWHRDGRLPTSISPSQLIYSPLRDVSALAPNSILEEREDKAIKVVFEEDLTQKITKISVRRGKNKNIVIQLNGPELGKRLQEIDPPYSIYVPGLAGIPNVEEFKSPAHVRKAAARGDANGVFRNILWLLRKDETSWKQFIEDFHSIFPHLTVDINYDEETEESLNAYITTRSQRLPIDAAGTGVLQAIQILAYVNVYQPKLLLLDEPDSHLHPNNQRFLSNLLVLLADTRDLQIILCTHSRHILDELSGRVKIHWIKDGKRVPEDDPDIVNVLMELGALDIGDRLRQGSIKCVILTEDKITVPIKTLFEASGFNMSEVEIWSYKGCSKIDVALTLSAFIRKHAAASKIIIHKDRDYNTDEEIANFRRQIEVNNVTCFITNGTDVESHFISAEHISTLYSQVTPQKATELISLAMTEGKEKSIEKFINSRTEIERRKAIKEGRTPNYGTIARDVRQKYDTDPTRYRHGKQVIGILIAKLQQETGTNPDIIKPTPEIKCQPLADIAVTIWPN